MPLHAIPGDSSGTITFIGIVLHHNEQLWTGEVKWHESDSYADFC